MRWRAAAAPSVGHTDAVQQVARSNACVSITGEFLQHDLVYHVSQPCTAGKCPNSPLTHASAGT